jgi:hypothetical protein
VVLTLPKEIAGMPIRVMTVSADEFIRRFLFHTLPVGFHRSRYSGFLANRHRAQNLARCRELLAMPIPEPLHDQSEQDYRDSYEDLAGVSLKESPANGADRGSAPPAASE